MSYAEVASEINTLFKYIDEDLVEKVPQNFKDFLKSIASPTYVSKIDPRFPLTQQYLLPDTEVLLAVLHYEFWATKEQRSEMNSILLKNENLLNEKYSADKIFDKVEEIKKQKIETEEVRSQMLAKEPVWHIKLFDTVKIVLKKIFNINNK